VKKHRPAVNETAARAVNAFMDLSVGDMDRLLPHLHRLRDEAGTFQDAMLKVELKRFDAERATRVKRTRTRPAPPRAARSTRR